MSSEAFIEIMKKSEIESILIFLKKMRVLNKKKLNNHFYDCIFVKIEENKWVLPFSTIFGIFSELAFLGIPQYFIAHYKLAFELFLKDYLTIIYPSPCILKILIQTAKNIEVSIIEGRFDDFELLVRLKEYILRLIYVLGKNLDILFNEKRYDMFYPFVLELIDWKCVHKESDVRSFLTELGKRMDKIQTLSLKRSVLKGISGDVLDDEEKRCMYLHKINEEIENDNNFQPIQLNFSKPL